MRSVYHGGDTDVVGVDMDAWEDPGGPIWVPVSVLL